MKKSEINDKVKKGDKILYKFMPDSETKEAIVVSKRPDNSGVYIKGIIKDKYFFISSDEVVEVIEGQKA